MRAECDLPPLDEDVPAAVHEAARTLRALSADPEINEAKYAQTGVLTVGEHTWPAFRDFAPYALDATFWSETWVDVASLSDISGYVFLRLTPDETTKVESLVGVECMQVRVGLIERWRSRLKRRS